MNDTSIDGEKVIFNVEDRGITKPYTYSKKEIEQFGYLSTLFNFHKNQGNARNVIFCRDSHENFEYINNVLKNPPIADRLTPGELEKLYGYFDYKLLHDIGGYTFDENYVQSEIESELPPKLHDREYILQICRNITKDPVIPFSEFNNVISSPKGSFRDDGRISDLKLRPNFLLIPFHYIEREHRKYVALSGLSTICKIISSRLEISNHELYLYNCDEILAKDIVFSTIRRMSHILSSWYETDDSFVLKVKIATGMEIVIYKRIYNSFVSVAESQPIDACAMSVILDSDNNAKIYASQRFLNVMHTACNRFDYRYIHSEEYIKGILKLYYMGISILINFKKFLLRGSIADTRIETTKGQEFFKEIVYIDTPHLNTNRPSFNLEKPIINSGSTISSIYAHLNSFNREPIIIPRVTVYDILSWFPNCFIEGKTRMLHDLPVIEVKGKVDLPNFDDEDDKMFIIDRNETERSPLYAKNLITRFAQKTPLKFSYREQAVELLKNCRNKGINLYLIGSSALSMFEDINLSIKDNENDIPFPSEDNIDNEVNANYYQFTIAIVGSTNIAIDIFTVAIEMHRILTTTYEGINLYYFGLLYEEMQDDLAKIRYVYEWDVISLFIHKYNYESLQEVFKHQTNSLYKIATNDGIIFVTNSMGLYSISNYVNIPIGEEAFVCDEEIEMLESNGYATYLPTKFYDYTKDGQCISVTHYLTENKKMEQHKFQVDSMWWSFIEEICEEYLESLRQNKRAIREMLERNNVQLDDIVRVEDGIVEGIIN